jgi:hypothetical protein
VYPSISPSLSLKKKLACDRHREIERGGGRGGRERRRRCRH